MQDISPERYSLRRAASWSLIRAGALLFALLLYSSSPAKAQRKEVWGVVTNSAGQPVEGAAVKLTNRATLTIRSFLTQANGEYRFYSLNPNVDYTVRAEKDGNRSKPQRLSYFKSSESVRADIQLNAK